MNESMDRMEITRKELYDLVWSEPMTAISKRIGVETYQLKKACIENKIPLPICGHWTKLQFGKKVDILPLPENQLEEKRIVFDFSDKKEKRFIDLLPLLKVPSRLVSLIS
jgi:hypothetical protein